jgi:hypothetical protein
LWQIGYSWCWRRYAAGLIPISVLNVWRNPATDMPTRCATQVKWPVGSALGDQGRAQDGRRLASASSSRMRHPHRGSRRKFAGQSRSALVGLLTPPVGQAPSLS